MLQIKNISKEYITGDLHQKALDKVSLNLRDNEFVSILGPSGSGKTTLVNLLLCKDNSYSGNIYYNDVDLKEISLDSLFEDDVPTAGPISTSSDAKVESNALDSLDSLSGVDNGPITKPNDASSKSSRVPKTTSDIDIQKELEAKFDELFGALDDDT